MRARHTRGAAASIALAGLATATRAVAGAPPEPVRLVWIRGPAADACQSQADLADRVTRRLGAPVFDDAARRSIEGFVQREGDRWVAHLYARDREGRLTGSRELSHEGQDCSGLDAAVTLAIALVIDPEAALRPAAVPSTPPAAPPTPPPPPPPAPPPATPYPAPAPAPNPSPAPSALPPPAPTPYPTPEAAPAPAPAAVTTRVLVTAGLLPSAAPGFAIAADLPAYRALHATAGAVFLPEARTSDGDFGFGLTAGWVGACVAPYRSSRLVASLCGELLLGAIHSVVYAYEPTQPGDRFWSGADAEAALRLRVVGPLTLEGGAQLVVPLTRQPFDVQGKTGTEFQEWAAAVTGFLGLGVSIP